MPIYGFVGPLGGGKTYNLVKWGLERAYVRDAVLISFIDVTPAPASGVEFRKISLGRFGIDEDELLGEIDRARELGKGAVVLIDEVGILLPARQFRDMSRRLMYAFSQSRKMGVDVGWTAQDESQVDAFLRRLTINVRKCTVWPAATLERFEKGKRPRLFILTDWLPGHVGKRGYRQGWTIARYDRRVETMYDTLALVEPPEDAVARESEKRARRAAVLEKPSPGGGRVNGGARLAPTQRSGLDADDVGGYVSDPDESAA